RRATALAALGRWSEAPVDFRSAADILKTLSARAPDDPESGGHLALAQIGAGDQEGYRQSCRALLQRFGGREGSAVAYNLILVCTLVPGAGADPARLVTWAEKALPVGSRERGDVLEGALYRAGRFADAVAERSLIDSMSSRDVPRGLLLL